MLHSADEVAQVRCGIHRDKPPDALVIFEDVDAGIVLLDLPEAADAHAEEVADDDLIYCIVRCDEDGFPVILFCIFVKSSADTFPDIFQGIRLPASVLFPDGYARDRRIPDTWLRSHRHGCLPKDRD